MCESCNRVDPLSRRTLLAGAAVGAAAVIIDTPAPAWSTRARNLPTVSAAPGLEIVPREAWAEGRPPRGEILVETDVRFLLVHHTAEPGNSYGAGDAPSLLRGMYDYHTSPAKKWPDIAYNFLVDQFGVVYEGRAGSLTQASVPDATGGSQGFSQLACFIGNLDVQPPTVAAQDSMDRVLAYLAGRHSVDITPGATTDFISRGSNRHSPGVAVRTKTVAGHRDMSLTTCPGDFAYAMVEDNSFAVRASALRQAAEATPTAPPPTADSMEPTASPNSGREQPSGAAGRDDVRSLPPVIVGGGALTLAAAASAAVAVTVVRRRSARHVARHASRTPHDETVVPASLPDDIEASNPLGPVVGPRDDDGVRGAP